MNQIKRKGTNMKKKWKTLATNAIQDNETKEEKVQRMQKFDNLIRNTKKQTEKDVQRMAALGLTTPEI